ncbi:hypothetical protein OESDEN_03807 [Oesophagostomum dentatum]|uniref:N-terminal Ras-GEF domain-containing protein n=1 Tax=Oesophagostomum dentatum TaxID=61180 RepID=A0A0B1TFC7_OESDE|nr:hypothetical protein OESDEN_03807 [Oesophagostomum dentatum]
MRILNCYNHDDGAVTDDEFLFSLFIAHQWLVDSVQLLTQFTAALQKQLEIWYRPHALILFDLILVYNWQETTDLSARTRLSLAVVYWIRRFPHHFDGQPQLCSLAVRFRALADDVPDETRQMIDVSSL